jgi:hypothetical protein
MPAIGDTIARLGAAWSAGDITLDAAVDQLRDVDPSLSVQGARAQIRTWKSAASRYGLDTGLDGHLDSRAVSTSALRQERLVFRFTAPTAAPTTTNGAVA